MCSDTKHWSRELTGVSGKSTLSVFSGERKQDTASSGKTSSSKTSASSATAADTVQSEGEKLTVSHIYFCFCLSVFEKVLIAELFLNCFFFPLTANKTRKRLQHSG